jgi:IS30 family transposase
MSDKKYNQKHLTMTKRIWIEKGLNDNESFASISRRIGKHPSSSGSINHVTRTFEFNRCVQ